jgi:omega-6 fatty acid desaturase (delta-12 desaturase)
MSDTWPEAADASDAACATGPARTRWRPLLAPYARPDGRLGAWQLLNTGPPFVAIVAAILGGLAHGLWPVIVLVPLAAGLMVRLFAIQHDCGHGSFLASGRLNDWIGRVIGVVTLTPYEWWRQSHAIHHASSGNLDRRGVGDVHTLTVAEYRALPPLRRLAYRLYRHPAILFGVGAIYLFWIRHRIPSGNRRAWLSVLGTNAAIAALIAGLVVAFGTGPVLFGYLPVLLLAAPMGVWLFYVQHQFEGTYWETPPNWNFHTAAIEGSSFYDLPTPLHWITGHIGFHHVHHLSSRIPNYRLRECHERTPALHLAKRLSLRESLRCTRLSLWDEERRRLVSFVAAGPA